MTVSVFRIYLATIKTPFDGEGASLYPGRWNSRGVPMVYTAGSRALAMLEILANFDAEDVVRKKFRMSEVLIPDRYVNHRKRRWPKGWTDNPPPAATRKLGDEWIRSASSVALAVPSAIVPKEFNYLLNPRHPDFDKLTLKRAEPIEIDPRLKA